MFENQKLLAKLYAVRYLDSEGNEQMVLQGKKDIKLFRKYARAQKVADAFGINGAVINLKLNELTYPNQRECVNTEKLLSSLEDIYKAISRGHSVDVYKSDLGIDGGVNVIRHTLIGEKPVNHPGDSYTDVELHLQVRINH